LSYLALSLFGLFSLDGVTISNSSGFTLMVAEPCSAFHNTIITSFIWLSLIKIQRLPFRLKHFVVLAIGLIAVVLLNTARIGIMAVSYSQYLFWHMGPGLWVVKIVMLTAVLGLFYLGLRPGEARDGARGAIIRPRPLSHLRAPSPPRRFKSALRFAPSSAQPPGAAPPPPDAGVAAHFARRWFWFSWPPRSRSQPVRPTGLR
jgi:hypothetical protein